MTQLLIFIDSQQQASALLVKEDSKYEVISMNGNDYESDLKLFSETVMSYLRATPLSKLTGERGGISVIIGSNGAENKTIRTILDLFLHNDDESDDCHLNVNIDSLNIIEAKNFLSFFKNKDLIQAADFIQFFSLPAGTIVYSSEMGELKKQNQEAFKELEAERSKRESLEAENAELKEKLDFILNAIQAKINLANSEEEKSKSIIKVDFQKDGKRNNIILNVPVGNTLCFTKAGHKNGDYVREGDVIAKYSSSVKYMNNAIKIKAEKSGKIFYMVSDNSYIEDKKVIAVIGDFNSLEEARKCADIKLQRVRLSKKEILSSILPGLVLF